MPSLTLDDMKRISKERILAYPRTRADFASPDHIDKGALATLDQVDTAEVVDSAVTANSSSKTDSASTVTTTETIFNTITVTTDGGEVGIWASAGLRLVNGNIPKVRIRKDDVTGDILYTASPVPNSDNLFQVPLLGFDSSPSGTQLYVLTAVTGNSTGEILERSIFAINTKK